MLIPLMFVNELSITKGEETITKMEMEATHSANKRT